MITIRTAGPALCATSLVLGALACGGLPHPGATGWALDELATIDGADVTVLEGLPHPMWEEELLASERATKPVFVLHTRDFYDAPLQVTDAELDEVVAVLLDSSSFHEYGGEKMCGGFHPDIALQWTVDGVTREVFLCFGCDEAEVFRGDEAVKLDVASDAIRAFERIFGKHHQSRPASDYLRW